MDSLSKAVRPCDTGKAIEFGTNPSAVLVARALATLDRCARPNDRAGTMHG
jgi:hypothetical protein